MQVTVNARKLFQNLTIRSKFEAISPAIILRVFLAKKLFLRMVAMVPETLSCAVRLLPGLDGGLTKHHFY